MNTALKYHFIPSHPLKSTTFEIRMHFFKNTFHHIVFLDFSVQTFHSPDEKKTQSLFCHLENFIVNSLPAVREVGVVYFTARDL